MFLKFSAGSRVDSYTGAGRPMAMRAPVRTLSLPSPLRHETMADSGIVGRSLGLDSHDHVQYPR